MRRIAAVASALVRAESTQFNIKGDPDVIDEFYRIADAQGWVLGETLERALKALREEIAAREAAG